MEKFYQIIRLKIMLICVSALLVIFIACHATVYATTKRIMENQMGLTARSVAAAIAHNLTNHVMAYKGFIETRDTQSGYYKAMQAYFAEVKEDSNIKYIYTDRQISEDKVEFILDAEPPGSEAYSPPGSTAEMDEQRKLVYRTGKPAHFKATHYPVWGDLIVAIAPIVDRDGALLGTVGINIDSRELVGQLNRIQYTMFAFYAVILVIVVFILSKYSSTMLSPVLTDKLTGAVPKRYFDRIIREEIKYASKNNTDLAVLMLDLDHFKKVNDTYGHVFGDKVLKSVAHTIRSFLRKNDYFVRYGGEEFVVMISSVEVQSVLNIAERIRKAVEQDKIFNEELNVPVNMTISIGVSHYIDSKPDANTLLETADKALYDAKTTRNAVAARFRTPQNKPPQNG